MGFFDEFTNLFAQEKIDKSFRVEILGRSAVCVEGYKKIESLESSEVVLQVCGGAKVIISGAKLYVKKLEEGELVVSGAILNVSIE